MSTHLIFQLHSQFFHSNKKASASADSSFPFLPPPRASSHLGVHGFSIQHHTQPSGSTFSRFFASTMPAATSSRLTCTACQHPTLLYHSILSFPSSLPVFSSSLPTFSSFPFSVILIGDFFSGVFCLSFFTLGPLHCPPQRGLYLTEGIDFTPSFSQWATVQYISYISIYISDVTCLTC